MITNIDFLISLATAIFVGGAAGYLGSLMATKKMSLVGDALSHVALPGVGLALAYGVNISLGAFASLVFGILLIWKLEAWTKLSTEILVGAVFVFSLAVGFLVTPQYELLDALFGDIESVNAGDALVAVVISIIVFLIARKIYPKMMLAYVSEDLALANKVRVEKYNLVYLFLVAAIVAFGIKVGGSLLTSAMIIIPAAVSRNISRNMFQYSYLSMTVGMISAFAGVVISSFYNLPAGPVIILASIVFFATTLVFKRS